MTRQTDWLLVDIPQRCKTGERHQHKQCLGVVWAVLILRLYLKGNQFKIIIDHDGLHWILNLEEALGKLTWYRLPLSKLEFEAVPRAGIKHHASDALPRLLSNGEDKTDLSASLPVLMIGLANEAREAGGND